MKRDFDLIRKILLYVEENQNDNSIMINKLEDYENFTIVFHCKLLKEKGYLEGKAQECLTPGDDDFQCFGITYEGYEFLDKIRDTSVWKEKKFVKGYVNQIFHMPLNMGKVITETYAKITEAKADVEIEDFLILAYDPSPWKSELYFTVSKDVPSLENVTLSGKYISKVFDGPYNMVPQWIQEFDRYLEEKKLFPIKYYFHYAYCPKCSKKYGHNYVVAFAQIEE